MRRVLASLALLAAVAGASAIYALPEVTPTQGSPAPISASSLSVASVVVQADPANTGYILVEDASAHVMAKLAAGQSFTPPIGRGGVNLNSIYLDASAASQGAFVSYAIN